MDQHLDTLKRMEKELRQQLELSPIFAKWKQITHTIEVFSKESEVAEEDDEESDIFPVPDSYSIDMLTWRQKVKFAVAKLGECTVNQMVEFLQKQGEKMTKDKLIKRVGVTASKLSKDGNIKLRLVGRKGLYSL